MPQASDLQRALMAKWFPHYEDGTPNEGGIADGPPARFLLSHGFVEKCGMWYPPTPTYNISPDELACLEFLCDEWDYAFECSDYDPHNLVDLQGVL